MIIDAVLNRNVSKLVDASNLDFHPDLDIVWDVLSEAKDASINDVVNQLLIIQVASISNHRSKESGHGIDLQIYQTCFKTLQISKYFREIMLI